MNKNILLVIVTLSFLEVMGSSDRLSKRRLQTSVDRANRAFNEPTYQNQGLMSWSCLALCSHNRPKVGPKEYNLPPLTIGFIQNKTPYSLFFYDYNRDKMDPVYSIAPGTRRYPLDPITNSQYIPMGDSDTENKQKVEQDSRFYVKFFDSKGLVESGTTSVNVAVDQSLLESRVNAEKKLQILIASVNFSQVHEKIWHLARCKKCNRQSEVIENCMSCNKELGHAKVCKAAQLNMVFGVKSDPHDKLKLITTVAYDINQKK